MDKMGPLKVRIKKGGNGHPPYWYSNLVGQEFVVVFNDDAGVGFGNGFLDGVWQLVPGKNPGQFDKTSNIIRPDDVRIILESKNNL